MLHTERYQSPNMPLLFWRFNEYSLGNGLVLGSCPFLPPSSTKSVLYLFPNPSGGSKPPLHKKWKTAPALFFFFLSLSYSLTFNVNFLLMHLLMGGGGIKEERVKTAFHADEAPIFMSFYCFLWFYEPVICCLFISELRNRSAGKTPNIKVTKMSDAKSPSRREAHPWRRAPPWRGCLWLIGLRACAVRSSQCQHLPLVASSSSDLNYTEHVEGTSLSSQCVCSLWLTAGSLWGVFECAYVWSGHGEKTMPPL